MRVVCTVGVEGVFDCQIADRAPGQCGIMTVRVTGLALVLGVEPARTTAVRPTIWHCQPRFVYPTGSMSRASPRRRPEYGATTVSVPWRCPSEVLRYN